MTQVFQHQRLAMQFLILFETDIGTDAAGRLDVIELDFFYALGPGRGLLGLGGIG